MLEEPQVSLLATGPMQEGFAVSQFSSTSYRRVTAVASVRVISTVMQNFRLSESERCTITKWASLTTDNQHVNDRIWSPKGDRTKKPLLSQEIESDLAHASWAYQLIEKTLLETDRKTLAASKRKEFRRHTQVIESDRMSEDLLLSRGKSSSCACQKCVCQSRPRHRCNIGFDHPRIGWSKTSAPGETRFLRNGSEQTYCGFYAGKNNM